MTPARVLLFAALLAVAAPAEANEPSFQLPYCARAATHIVVASEGDTIDGEVEVLESWKGDLSKGQKLTVPELAEFASDESRAISKEWLPTKLVVPPAVTGGRMVLFLFRQQGKGFRGLPGPKKWLPTNIYPGNMRVSVVWVEETQVFAIQQMRPSLPSVLTYWGPLDELKRHADDILTPLTTLDDAIRLDDPKYLAKVAPPLVKHKNGLVDSTVIHRLGAAGKVSLPALRAILEDESLSKHHKLAVESIIKAGGADAGPELQDVLKQELAFWKKTGPELPKDWKAALPLDEAIRLNTRMMWNGTVIYGLGEVRHADARDILTEFRDLWQSFPAFGSVSPLSLSCNRALKKLDRN